MNLLKLNNIIHFRMNKLVTMNEEKEAPEEVASNLSKYVVDLEDCGPFEIFVEVNRFC